MSDEREVTDARWSVWFYRRGSWTGRWVYFSNAEGCTRTLLIGTPWTGFVVFGLWRIRFDPECPECLDRAQPRSITAQSYDITEAPDE